MSGETPRITRMILQDFRNYRTLDWDTQSGFIALIGENGVGKTNLLEAISLFTPGRGLRRAEWGAMACQTGAGGFSVALSLASADFERRLGTGILPDTAAGKNTRLCRIEGVTASPTAFAEYVRIVWLTPDFDGLFRGSAGDRRRFLDRLVLAIDAGHGARVGRLERALRSRNKLLAEHAGRTQWLDAIERETAEIAVAVAAARRETVQRLQSLIRDSSAEASPFPWAALSLEGDIDTLPASLSAIDAEDRYREMLKSHRARDREAGRTLIGPQATDLRVRHGPKDVPAGTASTGEQKALLIGVVLAHARLVAAMSGLAPVILLDEVAAHLDPNRRRALFEALRDLQGQVWMTGADPSLFHEAEDCAVYTVEAGRVR